MVRLDREVEDPKPGACGLGKRTPNAEKQSLLGANSGVRALLVGLRVADVAGGVRALFDGRLRVAAPSACVPHLCACRPMSTGKRALAVWSVPT